MPRSISRNLVALALLLAGTARAQEGRELAVVPPTFTKAKIDVYTTSKIELALQLMKEMPQMGWQLEATGGDDDGKRAVLRYFPHPPKEDSAKVETVWPTPLRFPLGSPAVGDRVVEIVEEAEGGKETLVQVYVVRVEGEGKELEGGFVARSLYGEFEPRIEGRRFLLKAVRKMKAPGWRLAPGAPKRDGNQIVIQVVETAPGGSPAKEPTPETVDLFLGEDLPAGRHVVVLRGGEDGEDVLQQAVLIEVR